MMIVEQFCQQKKGTCLGSNLSFREGILGCKKGLRSRTAYLYQQEILDKEAIDAFGVHISHAFMAFLVISNSSATTVATSHAINPQRKRSTHEHSPDTAHHPADQPL